MPSSSTSVSTDNASRYLQQLCKHWSHHFDVTFDPNAGHIKFGAEQQVSLQAETGQLLIIVSDNSSDAIPGLQKVVEDHLRRFAHRETLDFTWGPTA